LIKANMKILVKELPIRLGQFLKLADLVQDGFEARRKIQEGQVMVNGLMETRRGKKLYPLDTVTVDGKNFIVCEKEDGI
jgi:ribosome-associated protein